jgi:hypothetical protein
MAKKPTTPAPALEAKLTIEEKQSPAAKRKPIETFIAELNGGDEEDGMEDGEGLGKIFQILKCYVKGYWKTEIVAAGFNRSTVYRQCGEYDKLRKGELRSYQGFEVYEGRLQRIMKRKSLSRDEAAAWIAEQDLKAED